MHGGVNHWLLPFDSNGHVQVCDSLHTNLTQVTKNYIKALYRSQLDKSRSHHDTSAEAE